MPEISSPAARPSIRVTLVGTLPGRALLASAALKIVLTLGQAGERATVLQVLNTAATVGLILSLGYFLGRLLATVKRRLLWRVRRKLILSYVFIGFVPVLLVVAFFLLAGVMLFLNVSGYLVRSGFKDLVDEASLLAETTAGEIGRGVSGTSGAEAVLERKLAEASERYPGLSLALVPRSTIRAGPGRVEPIIVGPWRHLSPPAVLPSWVSRAGFGGLLASRSATRPETQLTVRTVGLPDDPDSPYAVVVDLPVDRPVLDRLRDATGIQLGSAIVVQAGGERAGAPASGESTVQLGRSDTTGTRTDEADTPWGLGWVTFLDIVDWESGETGKISLDIRVRMGDIYERLSGAEAQLGSVNLGYVVLLILGVIGGLFLVIEVFALIMGFALARSITGSVHELFVGTERVREGDFSHQIRVKTDDQLGELAESFNSMTRSIEDLLRLAAEKRRLEEELRIARQIQMSLLPAGPAEMRGLSMTASCVPAREVGGDYYDFFPLGENRLGILIADVSGKGTSAALYMAELKGLMLSLSATHQSPKPLLVEVNRILSEHLDSRSFVTMTYAVLDLERRLLTYARAGHTPLIYLPAGGNGSPRVQVLTPDGLVLGLGLDGVAPRFEDLLEECQLRIHAGDLLVFFTDGVTEAMNEDADLFGETRLSQLVEEHGHLPAREVRERIARAVEAFVGRAEPHDDMTMILVKIEEDPSSW